MTVMNTFIIFIIFIIALSHGASVGYVFNPACATDAGGCNFNNATNWNTTQIPNPNDDVVISSNISITLILSGPQSIYNTLLFGMDGSSVTLVLLNTTLFIASNQMKAIEFGWGTNSALFAYESYISGYNLFGQNASLYNNSVINGVESLFISNLYLQNSVARSQNYIVFDNAISNNSTFNVPTGQIIGGSIIAKDSSFHTLAMSLDSYGEFNNSYISQKVDLAFGNNSIISFRDTPLYAYYIRLEYNSRFSFHADNNSNTLGIASLKDIGSEFHLGDNVVAAIYSGYANNLTLSNNVTLSINSMAVGNIQQVKPEAFAYIYLTGIFNVTGQIAAYVNITSGGVLQVIGNFQLSPGSSIVGSGSASLNGGVFNCSSVNVSFYKFDFLSSGVFIGSLTTEILVMNAPSNAVIQGNLVASGVASRGVILFEYNRQGVSSTLNVTGNFTQSNSRIAVDIYDNPPAPLILVSGQFKFDNVVAAMTIQTGNFDSSSFQYLLGRSPSGSMEVIGSTASGNIISSTAKWELKIEGGDLYVISRSVSRVSPMFYVVIAVVSVIVLVTIIFIVVCCIQRRNRHHYQKV